MSTPPFRIEALGLHDRSGFSCGVEPLDSYVRNQVGQDIRRRVAACYVAVETATGRMAGYYTLSAADVALTEIPSDLVRRLPRYPSIPVARIGRLAVDTAFQGGKLGAALLFNAATRAARSEIAVFGLLVDAKDDRAEAFYRHHGFLRFGADGRQMMAAIATFRALL